MLIHELLMLEPTDGDWLVRLRSLGDVDRRALITIALYNVMDDLVRCIDDAVKSDIPRVLLIACLDTIWLGLKKTVSERA